MQKKDVGRSQQPKPTLATVGTSAPSTPSDPTKFQMMPDDVGKANQAMKIFLVFF
jgi:hypothetical protein